MIRRVVFALAFAQALAGSLAQAADPDAARVRWEPWGAAAFERAAREGKLVLLDLEAVWCHWCHVMDQRTYADAEVATYLAAHYIAIKVDQDARPDLANRYRDWGWPATVVFAADGTELVKRAGFIEPRAMRRLLEAAVRDPTPEDVAVEAPAAPALGELAPAVRERLLAMHRESFDAKRGGLLSFQKSLDRDSVEWALRRAAQGDAGEAAMARRTLDAALALFDPVWGGVYQYSTQGDWRHPHFEKIMPIQAGYLRIYVQAYAQNGDPRYLAAARDIVRYLDAFLSAPDGAFYVSQDADLVPGKPSAGYYALDDAARRRLGVPRVDTHRYARETGLAAEARAYLYEVTGERSELERALKATRWALAARRLPDGGFRHDAQDSGGPYLGDSVAMGAACLQLYRVTADRAWLTCAADAGSFVAARFRHAAAGFVSARATGAPVPPARQIDENVQTTRFLNLLARYTGDAMHRAAAEHGMRYLAIPSVATARLEEAGVLLAADELARDPLHLTVVGARGDAAARALYDAALRTPEWYKRVEWWDPAGGRLPNHDVEYPRLGRAAGFVCTESRCSRPAFDAADYAVLIGKLSGRTLNAPTPRSASRNRAR